MKIEHLLLMAAAGLAIVGCDKSNRAAGPGAVAAAPQPATKPEHSLHARGQVVQPIFTKAGQGFSVVIDSEDMPGFMAAMRMEYRLANPSEAARLKPGEKIDFDLVEQPEGDFAVTRVAELPETTPLHLAPASSQPSM